MSARATWAHAAACLLAFVVPWIPARAEPARSRFPGWPTTFEGATLTRLPLTEGEENLARQFPGRMARFTDGRRQILLRFVERDTRLFHPPAECMKALGYDVTPLPTVIDEHGHRWGAFALTRGDRRLVLRERIHEVSGERSWTDVSSWYWAAMSGRSVGPWWAVAVAAPATATSAENR